MKARTINYQSFIEEISELHVDNPAQLALDVANKLNYHNNASNSSDEITVLESSNISKDYVFQHILFDSFNSDTEVTHRYLSNDYSYKIYCHWPNPNYGVLTVAIFHEVDNFTSSINTGTQGTIYLVEIWN